MFDELAVLPHPAAQLFIALFSGIASLEKRIGSRVEDEMIPPMSFSKLLLTIEMIRNQERDVEIDLPEICTHRAGVVLRRGDVKGDARMCIEYKRICLRELLMLLG